MPRAIFILVPLLSIALTACQSAGEQLDALRTPNSEKTLTTGVVQKEIKKGMNGGDVAAVLGAPNIVTTDSQGEVWVYDKISTETATSASGAGATLILLGGGSGASAKTTTQRTLTIVIKFDQSGKVRDFATRSSSF